MIINLGDTIREKNGREGVITNIGIATERKRYRWQKVITD